MHPKHQSRPLWSRGRWSRRTKASLLFLILLFAEVPTVLVALGFLPVFPDQGPVWYDPFWVAIALSILVVCDLRAAYMTFCLKVTPSATGH